LGNIEGTPTKALASTAINITASNAQGSASVMIQIAVTEPLYEGQRYDVLLLLIGLIGLGAVAACVLQRRDKKSTAGEVKLASTDSAPALNFWDDKVHTLVLAKLILKDAAKGRKTAAITTLKDLQLYSVLRSRAWGTLVWVSIATHLFLIFPESTHERGHVLSVLCTMCEIVICGVHFVDVFLYIRLLPSRSVRMRNIVRAVLVAGILAEALVSLFAPIPRFLPALRPIVMLLREKNLRETTMGIWSSLPGIFGVYIFILAFLCAFSLLGLLLFVDVVEDATFFVSLSGGVWNLFLVMLTPWNIPTVVGPYIKMHRNLTVWYWLFFILLMVIFWMAQISSVTSKAYAAYQRGKLAETDRKRTQVFSRLFQLLWWFHSDQVYHPAGASTRGEQQQVLTRGAWTAFGAAVSPYPLVALDRFFSASCDVNGHVDRARFSQLSVALAEAPPPTPLHFKVWQRYIQRFLRFSVRVPLVNTRIILYEIAIDAITLSYCICIYNEVMIYREEVVASWPKAAPGDVDMVLFGCFSGVFLLDLTIKLLAFGYKGFLREVRRDAFVSLTSL
jgi:hypothetical protein